MKNGEEPRLINPPHFGGFGYQYEAEHLMECLDKGWIESDRMTWQMSLDIMETLDRIRVDAGIFFPGRDEKL
jgi:hypothetical protein